MTSQDGLALLKQMHQRGEITDEQYDTLRRHVLWGTPLPEFGDGVPAPRSGTDPVGGYVPGAATVGPDRYSDPPGRYPGPPGAATVGPDRHPDPPGRYPGDPAQPAGPAPRRYASRRERREAEEARAQPPPAAYPPPAERTGPLPPVAEPPPRWRHRRDDVGDPPPDGLDGPPPTHRHRHVPPDPVKPRRPAESEPDRRGRHEGDPAAGRPRRRPRRRSVVAVLTSVVLALALAVGGVYWFELRRQGLPPPAYARQACGTVRDWQQAVDSSNARLINQISRQQNKTTIRSDVIAYYTTIAGRTDQLRVAILDLGPADVTGGRDYSDSLAAAVGDQASGLRRLAGQAGRLDPAATAFPTDLQGILTGADTAVSAVTAALARPAAGITTELRTSLSNEPACAPYVG
ncbi:MAG TPA: SHOCT domain-containing protein [Mycobacteriales bacterium]|nr:SHOCT domain-containing protein [Mycobacteriales bacterium]